MNKRIEDKHHYNLENDNEPAPENYFSLADATAVYLFLRTLGLELEKMVSPLKLIQE